MANMTFSLDAPTKKQFTDFCDEVGLSAKFTGEKLHRVMIKWVAPILLVVILVAQVLSAFGIITI